MKNLFFNAMVFLNILTYLVGIMSLSLIIGGIAFISLNWKEFTYVSMTHCAGLIRQESELMKRFEELAEKEAEVKVCLNTDRKTRKKEG